MILQKLRFSIFILFLFLGTIQTINAQAALIAIIFGDKVASEKFNISMELGANVSNFSNIPDSKQFQSGLNFGIAGNLMLSENLFMSPAVFFISKRSLKLNSYALETGNPFLDNEFIDKDARLNLNYIDIPILMSYETNNNKFRFGIGPQVSFLTSSKLLVYGDEGDFNQNFKSNMNTTDFGMLTSVGYALGEARKGKGLVVQFRYYQGFKDVFKDSFNSNKNLSSFFAIHLSLPFITDELAKKNIKSDK